jgi:PAS domain S-box-containing protein
VISIVLVDDAPDVRFLLRTRLRMTNRFDVVGEGENGEEAIELARQHQPQLVLLDVSMPVMDGLTALRELATAAPATKVVMFTGFEEQGLAERAKELGAVDLVEKSVSIDELVARLVAAVGDEVPETVFGPHVPEPVLQEHLERFRAAFDQAAIGMATLTLTLGVVRANGALGALAGVPSGSLVGTSYADLAPPSQRENVLTDVGAVARGERDVVTIEHEMGDRAVVSTVAVVRDSDRDPLYLFVQAQDVSRLRQSEESFRLLVESVQDYAIFKLDRTGHVATWNRGAQRLKGYEAHEIIGRHFSIFYPEEAVARKHPDHELEIAAAEGRYEEEGIRVRKDGSTFVANVLITALRDRTGELVGFAKVTRDVTERNQLLHDLEQAAVSRAEVLAVTAHELRTPVAVVKGFGATLHEHWDDLEEAERRSMVAGLARSGERLSRLVEDLFTAARLETGALQMRPSTFDLVDVVHEVMADHAFDGITLDVPSIHVHADRGRVHQMLTNYLTNADRYGAPPIEISAVVDDGSAVVVVRDAGPGVRAALAPQLFGKFVTGGSKEGSGLGLFLVRELARAQHGEAWYEPAPGGGARFAFRVPLAP